VPSIFSLTCLLGLLGNAVFAARFTNLIEVNPRLFEFMEGGRKS